MNSSSKDLSGQSKLSAFIPHINKMISQVRETILKHDMIVPGDRVVVGVSGGPDSVCLLDILFKLKNDFNIDLIVAHFDHGLRPDQDQDETRFVEALALSLGVPFQTARAGYDITAQKGSLEEQARRARYRFFEDVRRSVSGTRIALGHNLDDQAETVLMRLLRGSGLSGLSGIPPVRAGRIIRPLIESGRREIESYLSLRECRYITDPSNRDTRYLRNRIRHTLLPHLQDYQPRIVEILGHTADVVRRESEFLDKAAEDWMRETGGDSEVIEIPLAGFMQLDEALRRRVIRKAVQASAGSLRRIGFRHLEAIQGLAQGKRPQSMAHLPGDITVERVYDRLLFHGPLEWKPKAFSYLLEGPGTYYLEALQCSVLIEECDKGVFPGRSATPWTAFLNADDLTYPLMIRSVRPGDRFVPFGMKGHKKLKDFFIDRKIPSRGRKQVPILTCRDRPLWICGLRIDDRCKITSGTRKVLKVVFPQAPKVDP
ncbi:MAG: tRNA lysidine(34) synthetase TilS [Desulfatiglans sp.]|nr:tRNA lysidine(34) synthetase TilS [Desulfatiglans sp.]